MSKWPDVDRWRKQADRDCCTLLFMGFFLPLILLGLAIWIAGYHCGK